MQVKQKNSKKTVFKAEINKIFSTENYLGE